MHTAVKLTVQPWSFFSLHGNKAELQIYCFFWQSLCWHALSRLVLMIAFCLRYYCATLQGKNLRLHEPEEVANRWKIWSLNPKPVFQFCVLAEFCTSTEWLLISSGIRSLFFTFAFQKCLTWPQHSFSHLFLVLFRLLVSYTFLFRIYSLSHVCFSRRSLCRKASWWAVFPSGSSSLSASEVFSHSYSC